MGSGATRQREASCTAASRTGRRRRTCMRAQNTHSYLAPSAETLAENAAGTYRPSCARLGALRGPGPRWRNGRSSRRGRGRGGGTSTRRLRLAAGVSARRRACTDGGDSWVIRFGVMVVNYSPACDSLVFWGRRGPSRTRAGAGCGTLLVAACAGMLGCWGAGAARCLVRRRRPRRPWGPGDRAQWRISRRRASGGRIRKRTSEAFVPKRRPEWQARGGVGYSSERGFSDRIFRGLAGLFGAVVLVLICRTSGFGHI